MLEGALIIAFKCEFELLSLRLHLCLRLRLGLGHGLGSISHVQTFLTLE